MSSTAFLARFGSGSTDESELQAEAPMGACEVTSFIERFAGFAEESFFFYDGTVEIKFDRVNHKYYRVGELGELIPVLNVSTVSKIVDKSNALIPWTAKVTIEKFLRIVPTIVLPGPEPIMGVPQMTFEEFSKLAMQAKTAHSDKLVDAGDVGSMAHNWLESYINALMAKDQAAVDALLAKKCIDERATSCVNAALAWITAHNVRWLDTERKVFSKKHDCSGTLDGRCIVDSCSDPACCPQPFKDRRTLCDWKTSNYLYIEFLFQVAAYHAFFLEEFPNETLEDIWVLRLGKEDGEFQPWHLEAHEIPICFEGFLSCLDLKRKVGALEEQMGETKARIKAVKKEQRASEREKRKAAEKAKKLELKLQKKAEREAEKARVKAETKATRELIKATKKKLKEEAAEPPVPKTATIVLKPGSLRYVREGMEIISQPGDLLFSSAVMCATEFWTGEKWEPTDVPNNSESPSAELGADDSDSIPVSEVAVQPAGQLAVAVEQAVVVEEESPVHVFTIPTED